MQQPWLSVLIPTYNGADYLPSALNSIIAQNDPHIECIVVDDGSTDATLAILNSYKDKLPIQLFQRERQGNWVSNTNYALSEASAEYVCFLHQDDLWLKGRLEIMKNLIEKYPEANLFLNASYLIDSQGKRLGIWRCPLPNSQLPIDGDLMIERLLVQNFIAIPTPIFKRELALQVGGLDDKLWYTADWEFWLKIAGCGETIYYPQPLSAFRVHSGSQTVLRSSSTQDFQQQLEIVAKKYWELWSAPPSLKRETWKVAFFSIEVNVTLATMIHGKKVNFLQLICSFLALGFSGWHRYLRDSRIWERVSARLKARLTAKSNA